MEHMGDKAQVAMEDMASGDKADFIGLDLKNSDKPSEIKSKAEVHSSPDHHHDILSDQYSDGSRRNSEDTSEMTNPTSQASEGPGGSARFELDRESESVSDFERLEKEVTDQELKQELKHQQPQLENVQGSYL